MEGAVQLATTELGVHKLLLEFNSLNVALRKINTERTRSSVGKKINVITHITDLATTPTNRSNGTHFGIQDEPFSFNRPTTANKVTNKHANRKLKGKKAHDRSEASTKRGPKPSEVQSHRIRRPAAYIRSLSFWRGRLLRTHNIQITHQNDDTNKHCKNNNTICSRHVSLPLQVASRAVKTWPGPSTIVVGEMGSERGVEVEAGGVGALGRPVPGDHVPGRQRLGRGQRRQPH